MQPKVDFADAYANLMTSLGKLSQLESDRYEQKLRAAKTLGEFYDAALALGYSANSKGLRDTDDERVHRLLNEITAQLKSIDRFFRVKLYPQSPEQGNEWKQSTLHDIGARYAFRDDGSLEIGVLDSELRKSRLHVGRLWTHVGNFDGSLTDFKVRLNEAQLEEMRAKFAEVDSIRLPR